MMDQKVHRDGVIIDDITSYVWCYLSTNSIIDT